MKIKLKKNHPKYSYVGKNAVDCCDEKCPDRKGFHPHDWSYRLSNGSLVHSFRCLTRERKGCHECINQDLI